MVMLDRLKARDIVLVVDDSPETLGMLTDALEEADVTVLVALEGAKALALVDEITPDVILMDAIMPGMNGFETCKRLKDKKNVAHVPVIFMTGLTETEHIVAGFEAGGVDYVTKPIVPDELIVRMHAHLANARLAQSARSALDATGRFLLAASKVGEVLWCTPQASILLAPLLDSAADDGGRLPSAVRGWLAERGRSGSDGRADSVAVTCGGEGHQIQFTYVGRAGPDEFLLRLVNNRSCAEETLLKERLCLTARESEVLLWIARGKSNRDISEILGMSARTVNKHLEQIYDKLGVENRASAAVIAIRTVGLT